MKATARKFSVLHNDMKYQRKRTWPMRNLFKVAEEMISAPDQVTLDQVRYSLGHPIAPSVLEECLDRHLLPAIVGDFIDIAFDLCRMTVAARGAHETTGVPASVLVGEAMQHSSDHAFPAIADRHDYFRVGKHFPGIGASFLSRACELADDSRFNGVLHASTSLQYLREISRCKCWGHRLGEDILDYIERYDLQELDLDRRPKNWGYASRGAGASLVRIWESGQAIPPKRVLRKMLTLPISQHLRDQVQRAIDELQ